MTTLAARISKLEKSRPVSDNSRPVLIIIYGAGHAESELVGVSNVNLPRMASEGYEAYLDRLTEYVSAGGWTAARPMICFAEHFGDE